MCASKSGTMDFFQQHVIHTRTTPMEIDSFKLPLFFVNKTSNFNNHDCWKYERKQCNFNILI